MPDLITKSKALELLEAAVAERGADYVYERDGTRQSGPGCTYVRGGQPSCLIGLAMAKAGVPIEQLAEWDTRDNSAACFVLVDDELATKTAVDVMATAQSLQDIGETWGEALQAAREHAASATDD